MNKARINNVKEITNKWHDKVISNQGNVKERHYMHDNDSKRLPEDGTNVLLDYSTEEKEMALFI